MVSASSFVKTSLYYHRNGQSTFFAYFCNFVYNWLVLQTAKNFKVLMLNMPENWKNFSDNHKILSGVIQPQFNYNDKECVTVPLKLH